MTNPYIFMIGDRERFWKKHYDELVSRHIDAEAALSDICQVDDSASWQNGHTGKMNAMAHIAREYFKNKNNHDRHLC